MDKKYALMSGLLLDQLFRISAYKMEGIALRLI